MYILNISFGSHILKADKIIWQNVMNKDRYSDSASISWLLQIFFTSSVFQLTVGKYVSLYGEVYFANIWWTRADIKMLDLDSGSCHHCLPFNFSHDRGKVCFLIWASLFRKYLMNQTRYRNGRSRFWIPQSQSTFDVSCDRGKYLRFLIWASLFRKYFMNQTRYRNGRSRFWIPQSQSTFDVSCDRGKYWRFLIWASLFRKYFMNQTRYRNARPRFWIPQSQSTFDVSCDRGKYLLYRKPDPWNIPQNVTSHTCDTWQMR